jgi:hypothetical protein
MMPLTGSVLHSNKQSSLNCGASRSEASHEGSKDQAGPKARPLRRPFPLADEHRRMAEPRACRAQAADALHIGKSTAARALLVLQERGFIVQVKGGTFHRKSRHSTEWRLTEFGCDVTGSLATKNFTRWQPKTQNPVPPQDRTVPVAGPIGPRSGTVPFQKARYGT